MCFRPLAERALGEFKGMAQALLRRTDQRGALGLFRRAFEDDTEGGVPEAIHFAGLVDGMDRKKGARFGGELVKLAEEVDPALAPHIAAGRILYDGGTSAGTSLLSRAAVGAKSGPDEGLIRKGFDPSIPEAEREKVQDDARDTANGYLLGSHVIGRNLARENYVHYLRASGQDKVWSKERVRKIEPFRRAEIANRQAFPAKIVKDWSDELVGLKEGERIRLSQVVATKNFPSLSESPIQTALEARLDNDLILAFGGLNFDSIGSLTAERRGNVITVRGFVWHGFQDEYDFGFLFKDEAAVLERHGEAKTYVNKAGWHQEIEGTFRMVDDELVAPSFRWTDASAEGGGPRDR